MLASAVLVVEEIRAVVAVEIADPAVVVLFLGGLYRLRRYFPSTLR